jgi:drug/metabolite transporter (DMT)-like permease
LAQENRLHSFGVPARARAVLEGVAATALWSSSFVFLKLALAEIGPLTLAGIRYTLAGVLLLPWLVARDRQFWRMPPKDWLGLLLIGIMAHTLGNGFYYVGLTHLTATTVTFLTTLVPVASLGFSVLRRKDVPSYLQILGLLISLAGYSLFFSSGMSSAQALGVALVLAGVLAYSYSTVLTREIVQAQGSATLRLTAFPLVMGGAILLGVALPMEGMPHLSTQTGSVLLFLVLANTVVAYLLYNHALRDLTAFEMNALTNLSPLGTALIAWFVVGETLGPRQIIAMLVAIVGVALVQLRTLPGRRRYSQLEKAKGIDG